MASRKNLIMVSPDPEGLGGISRIVKIWDKNAFLSDYNVHYVASTTDSPFNFFCFLKGLFNCCLLMLCEPSSLIYIHTSSYNSFRRKSFFILIALLFNNKIILHIHPTHFQNFINSVGRMEKKYISFLLHRIDGFVVLTEEMKSNMKKMLPEKPVKVLRNPVDLKAMQIRTAVRRKNRNLIFLGWYIKKKGVFELVDAVELLTRKGAELHLDFYGTKQIETLKEYVKKKGLSDQIAVHGWIDGEQKLEALYRSAMLVLPSHTEGIPNVILEAMATRTPIIATHVGGLKEVLTDEKNAVVVDVDNPIDLSRKILRCLEDKTLRERLAAAAYQEVKLKYDVRVIKKEFLTIMDEF